MPLHTKQHKESESEVTEHKENHLTDNAAKAASKPGSGSITQRVGSLLLFSSP